MTGGARGPVARLESSLAARLQAAERWAAPLTAAVIALLVILPGLGTFGLWDPQEMSIADLGRDLLKTGDLGQLTNQRPVLSVWLIAKSFKLVGVSEWGARLPFALSALLVLAATYGITARLTRPRVGLYACLILLGSPLFVFQARQVTSDLPMVAGATIAVYGLIGLAWPAEGRPGWARASLVLNALLAAGGLAVAYYGGAALLGVLPPLVGMAVAMIALGSASWGKASALLTSPYRDDQVAPEGDEETVEDSSDQRPSRRMLVLGIALGTLAVVLIVAVMAAIYDWMPGQKGQTMLSGKTLAPIKGFVKLVGGAWRPPPAPKDATFDAIVNQVVFGLFPWTAIIPVALLAGLVRARRDRRGFALLVALGWALAAYVIAALLERRVGDVRYPALPALAIAAALLLDELLRGGRTVAAGAFRPLAALFVFCAAVQIGRDAASFPDELPSVNLLGTIKMPPDLGLTRVLPLIGLVFGLSVAAALAPPGPGRTPGPGAPSWQLALAAARRGWSRFAALGAAIGLGAATAFGLWLAWTFTPTLSQHFSYKNVFATYLEERKDPEVLGVMGIPGNGPEYYARGAFERLDKDGRGRQALLGFLKRPERVFAVAPAAELCAIQQASGTEGFPYHVLDDENSRFLLLSNRLTPGKQDQNPLLQALRRAPPEHIKKQVSAVFDGQIELLGIDLPESVSHGSLFDVTLYFKVLKKPSQAWKVIGHFDGKSPPRIIGDHDPIAGRCATTYWQPGDYVIDKFQVTAGDLSHARGTYTLRVGFFKKVGAKYENMPVSAGNATPDHRVEVGTIKVR